MIVVQINVLTPARFDLAGVVFPGLAIKFIVSLR